MTRTALALLLASLAPAASAAPLTAFISSQTNVACNGGANGAATVSASGGRAPYTYSWSPSGGTGPTATGLVAGMYSVTVTDADGQQFTHTFPVTQPSAVVVASSLGNVSCYGGSNGFVSVTVSGGTPGYSYSWSPTGGVTRSISGLLPGTYSVVVTDANACTALRSFTVTQPSPIAMVLSHTDVACKGGNTGTATASASGGAGSFMYSWVPAGGTMPIATGLSAGTYTVTATDANGCAISRSATIAEPATSLTVVPLAHSDLRCNGGSDGAASVTASGGWGAFAYDWTPGSPTGDGTAAVTGLAAGHWTATVTDALGCQASTSVDVAQPAPLQVALASRTNVACKGGSDGALSVSVSGGTGSRTYDWAPGAPAGHGTASIGGLRAGSYTVTVSDESSCTAAASFGVSEPATSVTATALDHANPACNGGSDGSARVRADGGVGGYTYDWAPGAPPGDGTDEVTGLAAGRYTATVADANGCSATTTFDLSQPPAIVIEPAAQTDVACHGGADGAVRVTASGGTGALSFAWTPEGLAGGDSGAVTGLGAGSYTVTVTDARQCAAALAFEITEPPVLTANGSSTGLSATNACDGGAAIAPAGGTPPYQLSWSPGGSSAAEIAGLCGPTATATVTDAHQCTASFTAAIDGPSADLAISLSGEARSSESGKSILYTIAVSSSAPAPSPAIEGLIPSGTTFRSIDAPPGWSCTAPAVGGTGAFECTGPTLVPDAPLAFSLEVALATSFRSGTVGATVTVRAAVNDANGVNNTATASTAIAAQPDGGAGGCGHGSGEAPALAWLGGLVLLAGRRSRRAALR
jgi:hypothetical protein